MIYDHRSFISDFNLDKKYLASDVKLLALFPFFDGLLKSFGNIGGKLAEVTQNCQLLKLVFLLKSSNFFCIWCL